jgi:hypothetical protein
MMRVLPFLVLLFSLGCSTAPPTKPEEPFDPRQTLKSQAAESSKALLSENFPRLLELTHPAVVKGVGGETRFVKMMTDNAATMKKQGFAIVNIVQAEPGEIVTVGDEAFAIVPFRMKIVTPEGASEAPSYLIAASTDRGRTWKFIDGGGINRNREKLTRMLPNFPDKLELPARDGMNAKE